MGHYCILDIGLRNRTYSAYSGNRNVSYSDPAPFSTPQMLQEVYPISVSWVYLTLLWSTFAGTKVRDWITYYCIYET